MEGRERGTEKGGKREEGKERGSKKGKGKQKERQEERKIGKNEGRLVSVLVQKHRNNGKEDMRDLRLLSDMQASTRPLYE